MFSTRYYRAWLSIITWALSSKSGGPDDDPTACAFLYLSIVAFTLQTISRNKAKDMEMDRSQYWSDSLWVLALIKQQGIYAHKAKEHSNRTVKAINCEVKFFFFARIVKWSLYVNLKHVGSQCMWKSVPVASVQNCAENNAAVPATACAVEKLDKAHERNGVSCISCWLTPLHERGANTANMGGLCSFWAGASLQDGARCTFCGCMYMCVSVYVGTWGGEASNGKMDQYVAMSSQPKG